MTDRIAQVYLIQLGNTNYFKVGMTTDINGRLAALQTATPFELYLITAAAHPNAFVVERDMHDALKEYHVRNEWFKCELFEIEQIFHAVSAMATIDRVLDDPGLDQDMREAEILQMPTDKIGGMEKEQKIALMLGQKFSYRQIGRELGVSHSTIATVGRLLRSGGLDVLVSGNETMLEE